MKISRQSPGASRTLLRQRAFTLTELLVLVGTIIILTGILFTTIWRSKVKGYTVYSQNNLRQLVTSYLSYRPEMDRFMPYSKAAGGAWVEEIKTQGIPRDTFFSPICNKNRGFGPGDSKTAWRRLAPESEYEYVHHY